MSIILLNLLYIIFLVGYIFIIFINQILIKFKKIIVLIKINFIIRLNKKEDLLDFNSFWTIFLIYLGGFQWSKFACHGKFSGISKYIK